MVSGTTPPGAHTEEQAAAYVQRMFADIAPRYDLLNHLLSFNIDRGWRKALMRSLAPVLENPAATVLDLCCGTGDVMFDLQRDAKARVLGADFCHPMLVSARGKGKERNLPARVFEADALTLPVAAESLDAIAIAFGFRNLTNYGAGLAEFQRVLKPGGRLAILEFSHPTGLLTRVAYSFYSRVVLPWIGGVVSGSRAAYTYLPESIEKFPRARELERQIAAHGFSDTKVQLLSRGIAALHTGLRR